MLQITIPETEKYNENTGEFITIHSQNLSLEHSLLSVSKWESKWHKPFINKNPKTREETIDYVRCMTVTPNVNPIVYSGIGDKELKQIIDYIQDDMTATWFSAESERQLRSVNNGEEITSELIYYWMTALNIPMECQKWHLNRLLTLIKIANLKNQPQKNMTKAEVLKRQQALNAARRKPKKR